jgi:hypothetical protein
MEQSQAPNNTPKSSGCGCGNGNANTNFIYNENPHPKPDAVQQNLIQRIKKTNKRFNPRYKTNTRYFM